MGLNTIFFDDAGRLRSGWRFAIFVFGFIFVSVVLLTPVTIVFTQAGGDLASLTYFCLINASTLASALVVGWLCARFLEQLPFSSLGASFTRGWLLRFFIGAAIGAFTLGFAVAVSTSFGGLSFQLNDATSIAILQTLGLSMAVFAFGAASEEAVSRGYPMQTFFRSELKVFGIVFMAALFASGHFQNDHFVPLAWFNTFLAGVWFGVAYWRTGDLWFPFGMHLAWNWMQGAFFGIEVSGLTNITSAPILKEIDRGPAWLTGEAYGIEGGIACTVAVTLSTLVIYLWPRKKDPDQSDRSG